MLYYELNINSTNLIIFPMTSAYYTNATAKEES